MVDDCSLCSLWWWWVLGLGSQLMVVMMWVMNDVVIGCPKPQPQPSHTHTHYKGRGDRKEKEKKRKEKIIDGIATQYLGSLCLLWWLLLVFLSLVQLNTIKVCFRVVVGGRQNIFWSNYTRRRQTNKKHEIPSSRDRVWCRR